MENELKSKNKEIEKIIKSGNYIDYRVVIDTSQQGPEFQPISYLKTNNSSILQILLLKKTMESCIDNLYQEIPSLYLAEILYNFRKGEDHSKAEIVKNRSAQELDNLINDILGGNEDV